MNKRKKISYEGRLNMINNHADFSGDKNPRWIGGKKTFICDFCDKNFKRYKSIFRGNEKNIFCSKKCFFKWKKENYKSEDSPTYKIGHTKKTKKLQSEIMIQRMKNPKYRDIYFKSLQLSPNKPEMTVINLIEKYNLNIPYSGDGKEFVGNFNPDFIDKNKKMIIEIFGDYWHKIPKVKERDERRLNIYSKEGYKTLIIWENELKNPNQVVNKIKEFIKC